MTLVEEFRKLSVIVANENWEKQNDKKDKETDFIYEAQTVDSVIEQASENNKIYALKRWGNFKCHGLALDCFINCGAKPNSNKKDKSVDFYLDDIQFDVKCSVYPRGIKEDLNLLETQDQIKMAKWLYENQSEEGRCHINNRIFVVFGSYKNKWQQNNMLKLRLAFQMSEKIKDFVKLYKSRDYIQPQINDSKGHLISVKSGIIWIY